MSTSGSGSNALEVVGSAGTAFPTINRYADLLTRDQDWMFRILSWDTPQTSLENGVSTEGLQLRVYEPPPSSNWNTYVQTLRGIANGTDPNAAFINAQPIVEDGRWSNVQAYWGSGTPNWWGGTVVGKVAVSFRGVLVSAARRAWLTSGNTFTFAVAGSGACRIDVIEGSSRTTLLPWTDISESMYLSEGFVFSASRALAPSAILEVFYVQSGVEPWGGLVIKAIPKASPTAADAAAAPVLSGGLFAYGSPVTAQELPFIKSIEATTEPGAAARMDFKIPLLNPNVHDGHGWIYRQDDAQRDPGSVELYDGSTTPQYTLRRKRLIRLEVARRAEVPEWRPLFTGHVHDFNADGSGTLTVQCLGLESRMVEQYEQVPDRVSYMTRGYRTIDVLAAAPEQRKEPVYNIPAFDAWPLAWAIEELATRSGVDPSCFRKPWLVDTASGSQQVTLPWGPAQRFRGETLTGEMIRMPRPVRYGNAGLAFTETVPFDDEYVFSIEPTTDTWARSKELTDRLGYVWSFDASGAAELYPAQVPSHVRNVAVSDATSGTLTKIVNPSAFGASYVQATGSVTVQVSATAARIDLALPRNFNTRPWTVTVAAATAPGTPLFTGSIDPSAGIGALLPQPFTLFSSTLTAPGTNSSVVTVYSGEYREYVVTLTSPAVTGKVAAIDCLLLYAVDPDRSVLPTLSTNETAYTVATNAQQDMVRNKVTVVGRRKGVVTDSDKFDEAQAPTEQEFIVANAVDVRSITDPLAKNYVGYLKQSVIYDETIADEGLARYLSQVFIYRQSVPREGATISHPLLPVVRFGTPLSVAETRFETTRADRTQYVRSVTHRIEGGTYETQCSTDAWPDFPAYKPRTDINLADFDYKPVTGLSISYTSLSGHPVSNPSINDVKDVQYNFVEQPNVALSGDTVSLSSALPWPPVPGTLQIRPRYGPNSSFQSSVLTQTATTFGKWSAGGRVADIRIGDTASSIEVVVTVTDNPAVARLRVVVGQDATQRFYYRIVDGVLTVFRGAQPISFSSQSVISAITSLAINTPLFTTTVVRYRVSTTHRPSTWVANTPYAKYVSIDYKDTPTIARLRAPWQILTGIPRDNAMTHCDVRYRSLFPTSANVDPNGIVNGTSFSPFYDPYTSELGQLVSFRCAVLAEGMYRVSIRNWDDGTTVAWLTNPTEDARVAEQHWEFLPVMAERQFTWDGVDQVGLWNAQQSNLYAELVEGAFEEGRRPTVGSGFYCWNREIGGAQLGQQAYIWMQRKSDGTPIIGHGTYARWYVHIEAKTITEAVPEVSTKDDELAILTHLPEPTKLELKVEDFNPQTGQWVTPASTMGPQDIAAIIHNNKPIRVRFRVANRPGALWTQAARNELAVKLTREVHLRAVIGDQVIVYSGREFADSQVEDRTIYNRRIVNDAHTKQYQDSGYRKAKTFRWDDATDTGEAVTEWVFRPSDFKKDFRLNGLEESIRFGDYLQLEEVPQWNGARQVTAARSRLQFALMSYLFYLSAYISDRSGRSSWGINRSFIDQSKIYINMDPLDWPIDATYEQRRTIVCRQWTQEPNWRTQQLAKFLAAPGSLMDSLLEAFWWQHDITSNEIGATVLQSWQNAGLPADPYSTAHVNSVSDFVLPGVYLGATGNRQLGGYVGGNVVSYLGATAWNWEQAPVWIPSITRDLHPFFQLPPMVSPSRHLGSKDYYGREKDYRKVNCYWTVGGPDIAVTFRKAPSAGTESIKTNDAGAAETWTSPVLDYTSSSNQRFWPGSRVDIKEKPFTTTFNKTIPANALNYVRQNEMVHYETLRGVYSRGRYPVSQPIKVAPNGAYYLNPYRYRYGLEVYNTLNESPYVQFHTITNRFEPATSIEWFRVGFRSEYVWESGSMFPTNRVGSPRPDAVLWWRHRYLPLNNNLFYDYGAWTGWKDDLLPSSFGQIIGTQPVTGGLRIAGNGVSTDIQVGNPLGTGAMPVAVGPTLPQTTELVCHLILLPERRGS
jgi:hypothetical protein